MELFTLIVSSLYCLVLLVLGWIGLTVILGVRGGVEGGIRFFLLGAGLFFVFLTVAAILISSPVWLAVTLLIVGASLPWLSMLQYLVATRHSGALLMALPFERGKSLNTLRYGAVFVILGLSTFVCSTPLPGPKSYALGILCISLGVFAIIRRGRYSQIREKGIVYEFGGFYRWENVERYGWQFGEDKLTLTLKKGLFNQKINLRLPSQYRQEVVAHLSKHIVNRDNNEQPLAPIQKAG